MLRFKLVVIFIIFLLTKATGQQVLKGKLSDKNGNPIDNVNLLLYEFNTNKIINYSGSNDKGNFIIAYSSAKDSITLEIRCIGFELKRLTLPNRYSSFLDITLRESTQALKVITVEDKRPIVNRNDTLNYSAKSFSDDADRVLSDVLRKLPGIKVSETGLITYQNKPINKFYIEGKDLLNDRYGIATNNLPITAVDAIQVLQHHQPIKLLNGVESSDRAAINIKLNHSAKSKLLGNLNASIGGAPLLRDNNATFLKFSKKLQYINTLKDNNVGLALDEEISQQNAAENPMETGVIKQDILSIVRANNPPIDNFRYRFNNNSLINGNYLKGIGESFDIKFDAAYIKDYLRETNSSATSIYLPSDTISIIENQRGTNPTSALMTGVSLQTNTPKAYLNNTLRWHQTWNDENNFISSLNVNQHLSTTFANIVNDLKGTISWKGNLIGLASITSFTNLPQSLTVAPGQFSDLLNSAMDYDALIQDVQSRAFFNNSTLSIAKKWGNFSFSNKVGLLAHLQNLTNNLFKQIADSQVSVKNNFTNVISRSRLKFNDESKLTYVRGKLTSTIGANVILNSVANKDIYGHLDASRIYLNPSISFKYTFNSSIEANVSFYSSNNVTYDANRSFILKNYRNLFNSEVPLCIIGSRGFIYTMEYKNIVNGIFSSLSTNFSKNHSNILFDSKFNNFYTKLTAIEVENVSTNLGLYFNINKYYAALNSGVDLTITFDKDQFTQSQQGVLNNFTNKSLQIETKIISKVSKTMSIEHHFDLNFFNNSFIQDSLKTEFDALQYIRNKLMLKFFYHNTLMMKFNVEHYYNNAKSALNRNLYFADIQLQKSILKPKIDFALILSNVFNNKSYTEYSYNNYTLVNSTYNLRRRSVMLRTSFQF